MSTSTNTNSILPSYVSTVHKTEEERQAIVKAVRASMASFLSKLNANQTSVYGDIEEEIETIQSIMEGINEEEVKRGLNVRFNNQKRPVYCGAIGEMEWIRKKAGWGETALNLYSQIDSVNPFDELTPQQKFNRCVQKAYCTKQVLKSLTEGSRPGLSTHDKERLYHIFSALERPQDLVQLGAYKTIDLTWSEASQLKR